MALATRCPACETIFRISTAQAAAKGGMVRCGQCRSTFNSLDALVRVEDLEVIEEIILAPSVEPTEIHEPIDDEIEPVAAAFAEPIVPDEAIQSEEPAPVDDKAIISEWWLPGTETGREPRIGSDAERIAIETDRDDASQILAGRKTVAPSLAENLTSVNPTFMRPEPEFVPEHRAGRWVLGLLSLVALVALIGQAAYLWRDELAARWSPARPWLTAACQPLRCTIDNPAHPESVTIESASVQVAGANSNIYVLSALLRNRDNIDLRYPHLTLVLTDLQDRPILRRAFRPEDYLPVGPRSGFPAESELTIRVMFELTDLRFAGYRLEKFYP